MKRYLLLIALLTFFPVGDLSKAVIANEVNSTEVVERELDPELKAYAKAISVRISSEEENRGSGVIIGKQGSKYLVVTNHHVIRDRDNLSIQTEDGINHQGKIVENPITADDDIALLVFESSNNYQPVRLNSVNTAREEKSIYAVGYVAQTGEFTITAGNIERVISQPFAEGYQIGYSSDVLEGMSGGAIFDNGGDLVGINGIGAFPILDTAYQYEDGTTPSATEIEQYRPLSWGLSLHRLLTQLNPEIVTAYSLPQPETVADLGQAALTGWLGDLETKAKQITVRIDSSSRANGSGVIIAKSGNTYTVLTADHVLCEKDQETNECLESDYEIIAPDGQKYSLDPQTINAEPGVDLATFKFVSNQTYQVAELADYPLEDNDAVFVAGFPQLAKNTEPQWHFSLGYGFDKEKGLIQVNVASNSNSQENSESLSSQSSLAEGYEMVYTSPTYGGMSGGAVLDREGRVIGIHGQAEGETVLNNQSGTQDSIQLGYSLGIPINTFLGLKDRLGVEERLTVIENTSGELNPRERKTFETAILGTEISQSNATAKRWLERGNQLWRLRRYEDAEAAFNRVLELNEPELHYLAHYGKGLALKDRREYKLALASLEKATALNSEFAPAFQEKSSVLRILDRFDEALIAINRAIDLEAKNSNFYFAKALILQDLQRLDEGILAYNQAIEISPRAAFFNNRGLLYKKGEVKLALDDYSKAIEINPNLAEVYVNRGNLYAEQGKIELALSDYGKAIEINPNLAGAYYNRGNLYAEQGKIELALSDYGKAIEINPNLADVYNNRGFLYKNQGEVKLALNDYGKAIEVNPNLAEAYVNRGNLYKNQGEVKLALNDYSKAIALNPNYANAYNNRGNLYKNQGKIELALSDYGKTIDINPNLAEAYVNRGNLYAEQGKIELALSDYGKTIDINPNLAEAYVNRGNLYANQEKIELALDDYSKAIALNPNYAGTYINRGLLYKDQGKIELALDDYSKAIAFNPNYAGTYINRGLLYHKQGKLDSALADWNQVLVLNENYLPAIINIGLIDYEMGKTEKAQQQFERAVNIDRSSAESQLALATALFTSGEKEKAFLMAKSALLTDRQFADSEYLKQNLWGDKLIADTEQLLSHPQLQELLARL